MTREAALLGLLADLATDRDALIAQRDALKAENTELRAVVADLEQLAAQPAPTCSVPGCVGGCDRTSHDQHEGAPM